VNRLISTLSIMPNGFVAFLLGGSGKGNEVYADASPPFASDKSIMRPRFSIVSYSHTLTAMRTLAATERPKLAI
jgi:hypothetical protein